MQLMDVRIIMRTVLHTRLDQSIANRSDESSTLHRHSRTNEFRAIFVKIVKNCDNSRFSRRPCNRHRRIRINLVRRIRQLESRQCKSKMYVYVLRIVKRGLCRLTMAQNIST